MAAAEKTAVTFQQVLQWILPLLLSYTAYAMKDIGTELRSISTSLAVAVQRVEEHDRRIANLEQLCLKGNWQ